ncbi:HNH endonuclease [Fimbriimonas ginsengisoli]|uniref:Restriction endonuclease n=1 Tax=Fimbriimonas ginsengisoli Gsoil 348 TaxID=661478 RepID=A0A068NUI1_FIMGI|nr:HNH endonuclease [Fimbriimonas ginsengisoli]AIE87188.1 restriction endonuclease [Fimbriimonas ginsengisoli Gsoil 348]
MRVYVGITDRDWFEMLSAMRPDEVNFWKPGERGSFGSLKQGELFLFKLHSPLNYIVGGGYFVRFVPDLPVSFVWDAFREKNGVRSMGEFLTRIRKYRAGVVDADPKIGSIVLTEPFWFPRDAWIPAPADWPKSTVQGKGFDALDGRGHELVAQVRERLGQPTEPELAIPGDFVRERDRGRERYGEAVRKVRLGQGGFQVEVVEAYERRCALTGEKTLPVLQAAHIVPYSEGGEHEVQNGLLLRSDMHTLFDRGYLTITPDYRVEVSAQIQEQFTNGKLYYSYHGQELRSLPSESRRRPSAEFLQWHNDRVFVP